MNSDARVYAACVGRVYEDLARRLVEGATRVFMDAGGSVDVHEVPGAFELPLAAKYCAESGRYRGVACLGAVIRGETSHYDYVCSEAARGTLLASLETRVPIGFGVLTCDTEEQALDRAGLPGSHEDKGYEASAAALHTASVLKRIHRGDPAGEGRSRTTSGFSR